MRLKTSMILIIVVLSLLYSPLLLAGDTKQSRTKLATELTNEYKSKGYKSLIFKAIGEENKTLQILRPRIPNEADAGFLGLILTPDVVNRIKRSGFNNIGECTDGKSKKYPFNISREYYDEMQQFYKKMGAK